MKHFFVIIYAFILCLNENAFSQEVTDTIAVLDNATDILVTRQGGVTKIEAKTIDEEGFSNPFSYTVCVEENDTIDEIELSENWIFNPPFVRKNSSATRNVRRDVVGLEHLYAGWRFNYQSKDKVKNYFEVGIRQLIGLEWSKGKRHKSTFSIGIGIGSKWFKTHDGFMYGKDGDKLVLTPIVSGKKVKNSCMHIFSFQVPLLYKQNITKDINFSIGGIVDLNSYATAQTEITEGKLKYKTKYKGLQQNLLTPEIYAFLGVWDMGVYFTWSPRSLFRKNYGPEFKGFSIGIEIFEF